jgi:hypothetical protein
MESDATRQEGGRSLLQARAPDEVVKEVTKALRRFDSTAVGMRTVLLAYARSKRVQRAVEGALHLVVLKREKGDGEAPARSA